MKFLVVVGTIVCVHTCSQHLRTPGQVPGGEDGLQIWWVAGIGGLLNNQSHIADERLGGGLTLAHCEESGMLLNVTHNLELGHVASIEEVRNICANLNLKS
jgi:hypothetical protein